jgi:hypothetical protein
MADADNRSPEDWSSNDGVLSTPKKALSVLLDLERSTKQIRHAFV